MHRIFIDHHQLNESRLQLDQATAHHLLTVCRLSRNDTFELVLNQARLLHVKILSIENHELELSVLDQWALNAQRTFQISLIQALPKQDKFTDICRMCTELGVSSFYPVKTQYCDVTNLSDNKFRRAQMSIESAAKQSKQVLIPKLYATQSLDACCENLPNDSKTLRLVAYEESDIGLGDLIVNNTFHHVAIAIGPEGGFGPKDLQVFDRFQFKRFSLGSFILRTEHAGFAAISQLDGALSSAQSEALPRENGAGQTLRS
jgi:16S rRNA (uracil1498-N3)-methyltransferase